MRNAPWYPILLAALATAAPLRAQVCYSRTGPHCAVIAVTEGAPLLSIGKPGVSWSAMARAGVLLRLGDRSAAGAFGAFLADVEPRWRVGGGLRYRRWVSPTVRLDGDVALLWDMDYIEAAPRVAVFGSVGWRDWIALTAGVERTTSGEHGGIPYRDVTVRHVGVVLGGRYGVVAGAVAGIIVGVATVKHELSSGLF
jgi:hypothetical protein